MTKPTLVWKHGQTRTEALALIRAELEKHGYDSKVSWKEEAFAISIGPWGTVLNVAGRITDDEILLEKCTGAASSIVLSKVQEMLEQRFAGGARV